jgi:hypothetical protein
MQRLITPANLLRNTVREEEANAFDPDQGPCCDALHFRVHLEGTTRNAWNKSAIDVFVNDFLGVHPEYPSQEESVPEMVRIKSFATLDSLIRKYRESNIRRTEGEKERRRLAKNCYERKRKVSPGFPCLCCINGDQSCQLYHCRRNTVLSYKYLQPHLSLLEQLGTAGMSSDEERTVGHHTQYEVIVPAWRSDLVTAWLRIFDAFHSRARKHDCVYGDQRGAQPRMRVSGEKRNEGKKFVRGLPRNAYNDEWFSDQVHPEITVRPGPPGRYFHDVKTLE